MHHRIIAAVTVAAAALTIVGPGTVAASSGHGGTVYIETNAASGNAVAAYQRHADGTLTWSADYATGGKGTGVGLASQGSIALSPDGRTLFAVNAGSNDVSAFAVDRDGSLDLVSRASAGGTDPISVAAHGDLVYVLDAGGNGNIAGLFDFGGQLFAVSGWTQPLSGAGTSPEQVAFSPDGRVLVVTEKGANEIVTYRVGWFGRAGAPDAQASAGAAPYGFAFDGRGRMFVSEAATSALSSYTVGRSGHLTAVSASVVNGQLAACWVALTPDGREAYTIDAHSSTISSYAIHRDGGLTLDQGLAVSTGAGTGPLDASVSPDGRDLYVLLSATQQISCFRHRFAWHPHGDRDRLGSLRRPQRPCGSLTPHHSRARHRVGPGKSALSSEPARWRPERARSPITIRTMAPDRDRPILIVDDDAKIVRLVRTYLERERYRVIEAFDGAAALAAIQAHDPALVVLDLMMPEIDGLAVIRAVRARAVTPIIVLSARGMTDDRIEGLSLGADDYVPKALLASGARPARPKGAGAGGGGRPTGRDIAPRAWCAGGRSGSPPGDGRWAAGDAYRHRAAPPRRAPRRGRARAQPRPASRRGLRPGCGRGPRSHDRRPHRSAPGQAGGPGGCAPIHRDGSRRSATGSPHSRKTPPPSHPRATSAPWLGACGEIGPAGLAASGSASPPRPSARPSSGWGS